METVANMMVLPNKFPIQLSEEVEAIDLKTPEPEVGFLHLFQAFFGILSFLGRSKGSSSGSQTFDEERHWNVRQRQVRSLRCHNGGRTKLQKQSDRQYG